MGQRKSTNRQGLVGRGRWHPPPLSDLLLPSFISFFFPLPLLSRLLIAMDTPQHLPTNDVTVALGRSRRRRRDDPDTTQLHPPKRCAVTVTGNGDFEVRISAVGNDFRAVVDGDIRDFTATMDRASIEQPAPPSAGLLIEAPPVAEPQGGAEDLGSTAESGSDDENVAQPIDASVSTILGSSTASNANVEPEVASPRWPESVIDLTQDEHQDEHRDDDVNSNDDLDEGIHCFHCARDCETGYLVDNCHHVRPSSLPNVSWPANAGQIICKAYHRLRHHVHHRCGRLQGPPTALLTRGLEECGICLERGHQRLRMRLDCNRCCLAGLLPRC